MLEHHRRMEQVVGVDHRAFSEQLLDPAAATLVPLIQVGGELAPVGLVLFEQGTELLVWRIETVSISWPRPWGRRLPRGWRMARPVRRPRRRSRRNAPRWGTYRLR